MMAISSLVVAVLSTRWAGCSPAAGRKDDMTVTDLDLDRIDRMRTMGTSTSAPTRSLQTAAQLVLREGPSDRSADWRNHCLVRRKDW